MADVRPSARTTRSLSTSRSVTVAASQKSKPKNAPFKFLRKDEGRLSYSCQPDSPCSWNNVSKVYNSSQTGPGRDSPSNDLRASRSLRQAIANDMRKGKSQDPFAEVVIAVPKRTPPPNHAARDGSQDPPDSPIVQEHGAHEQQQQQQQQQHQHQQASRKLELSINHEEPVPTVEFLEVTSKPQRTSRSSEDPDRPQEVIVQRVSANQSHSTPRRGDDYEDMEWQRHSQRRYRGEGVAMSGNGVSRNSTAQRYLDPVDEDEYYQRSARNFFMRPQRQGYRVTREEYNLVEQLEDELHAAQEERVQCQKLKLQLENDRNRFEDYRTQVENELGHQRAELQATRKSENWQAKKDVKVMEERYKSTLELLKLERESKEKLSHEIKVLQQQLEGITTRLRETQNMQKAESSRLQLEIESLRRRNEELLEMTREQQIAALENSAKLTTKVPPLQIAQSAGRQALSVASSIAGGSEEIDDVQEIRPRAGNSVGQKHSDMALKNKQKHLNDEKERKRRESEEREKERKRVEAEEKERKRIEAEEKERKRLEAEEERRKQHQQHQHQSHGEEGVKEGKQPGLRSQRRVSGHPINTPRAPNSKSHLPATRQSTSQTGSNASVSRKPRRIPKAEELIADDEPMPAEDFPNDTVVSQTTLGENADKRELLYRSGKREIHYANGTRKVILPSGHVVLYFTNGDIKRTFPSGKSTYTYADAKTTHTKHPDGVQVFQFHSSGQIERHLLDGKKEILYPDGIYRVIFADGRDETLFPEEM